MSRRITVDGVMTAHLISTHTHLKNAPHDGTLDSYLTGYIVLQQLINEIKQSQQFTDQQQTLLCLIDTELKRIVKEATETGDTHDALAQ